MLRIARRPPIRSHVLLVENRPLAALLLMDMFTHAGWTVVVARDGRAALDAAARPDCVSTYAAAVVNHWLPDVAGKRVVAALRVAWPALPIVLVRDRLDPLSDTDVAAGGSAIMLAGLLARQRSSEASNL